MVLDIAIDTGVDTGVIINKVGYYVSFVMGIYYSLNGTIGLNVLNIGLVYLLLA